MIELAPHIERIARAILGEPNLRLSTPDRLRFGNNGSMAVEIAGAKRGQWFDHEAQVGGGPLELITTRLNMVNGAALDWLRNQLGIGEPATTGKAKIKAKITATYDYVDEHATLLFQVCRLDPKSFRQRRSDGKGDWTWQVKGCRQVPYRLPQLIATPITHIVYVPEGEKDVDNATKLGLVATCNAGGAAKHGADGRPGRSKWRPEFAAFFHGRDAVILADNDDAGRDHANAIAANPAPVARRVRIVELPGLPPKGDLSDWLAAGGTREQLDQIVAGTPVFIATATPSAEAGADEAGSIITVHSGLRHKAADAGLVALHSAGVAFYQRDRSIVRVAMVAAKTAGGEATFTPGILEVSFAILGRELGRAARWEKLDRHGERVRIDPPREVVEQIAGMAGAWPFPVLAGVIATPTMRPDGSLLLNEGYDAATGLVLLGAPPIPAIAEAPTRQDAEKALLLLDALLDEFPFRDGNAGVDRAVALSQLLTPILRGAMPAAPMHVANAPQPGTGKSYLADLASGIATGERCAVVAFSPDAKETEKRITGSALAGHPIIALDNASGTIEGDLLCQITERPLLQLRPLGTSKMVRAANTFTVLTNGNNAVVAADMVRRTVECRLDANMEAPETRQFRDNPLARIMQNRGAYIAACLTIARAFVTAGRPERLPALASYDAWSDLVRSPLVWLGRADPVASMSSLHSLDPKHQLRAAVFRAWAEELGTGGGYLTAELIHRANDQGQFGAAFLRPALRTILIEVARDRSRGGEIDPTRLGQWLGRSESNVAAGFKLTSDRSDAARPRWVLRDA